MEMHFCFVVHLITKYDHSDHYVGHFNNFLGEAPGGMKFEPTEFQKFKCPGSLAGYPYGHYSWRGMNNAQCANPRANPSQYLVKSVRQPRQIQQTPPNGLWTFSISSQHNRAFWSCLTYFSSLTFPAVSNLPPITNCYCRKLQ